MSWGGDGVSLQPSEAFNQMLALERRERAVAFWIDQNLIGGWAQSDLCEGMVDGDPLERAAFAIALTRLARRGATNE